MPGNDTVDFVGETRLGTATPRLIDARRLLALDDLFELMPTDIEVVFPPGVRLDALDELVFIVRFDGEVSLRTLHAEAIRILATRGTRYIVGFMSRLGES